MAQRDFWQLRIGFLAGEDRYVCGTEDVLRAAYDEIRDHLAAPDGTSGQRAISVSGMSASMDRLAVELTVLCETVRFVELMEY